MTIKEALAIAERNGYAAVVPPPIPDEIIKEQSLLEIALQVLQKNGVVVKVKTKGI